MKSSILLSERHRLDASSPLDDLSREVKNQLLSLLYHRVLVTFY